MRKQETPPRGCRCGVHFITKFCALFRRVRRRSHFPAAGSAASRSAAQAENGSRRARRSEKSGGSQHSAANVVNPLRAKPAALHGLSRRRATRYAARSRPSPAWSFASQVLTIWQGFAVEMVLRASGVFKLGVLDSSLAVHRLGPRRSCLDISGKDARRWFRRASSSFKFGVFDLSLAVYRPGLQ